MAPKPLLIGGKKLRNRREYYNKYTDTENCGGIQILYVKLSKCRRGIRCRFANQRSEELTDITIGEIELTFKEKRTTNHQVKTK